MATIIFGVIGAAVGSTMGPGGTMKGWAIGTTVGGLIEASMRKSVNSEVGKLTDLRYSGSNYGGSIPKVWGKVMSSGNVMWVANYIDNNTLVASGTANATHLVEHRESHGGGGSGGGGGGSTEYSYSASYAVAFCEGSTFLDDGTFSNRNPVIKKIWANDVLIYDVANSSNNKVTIRFHYGAESETVDTLIESAEGAGNAPAYRGIVYVVIQDHNLKPYGNQIPNIRAEIWTDAVNVGDIAEDICGMVNLYGSRVDFSSATAAVKGYIVTSRGNAQSWLEPLITTYATDPAEIDGKFKLIPRGNASVVTLTNADIGVVKFGEVPGNGYSIKLGVRSELPGRVDLSYNDIDKNYQQVTQTDIKQSADFLNPTQISLQVTMSATEARQASARFIDSAYFENDPVTITLSHKYRYLTPTDPITISTDEFSWNDGRYRIIKIEETSADEITCTIVKDEISSLTQVITGGSGSGGGGGGTGSVPVPCIFYPWSGSELRETDQHLPGFYVAATWASGGSGGGIYYSTDGGTTWIYGGYIGTRSAFGAATSTLAAGSGFNTWDAAHTVNVAITNDGVTTLAGTTDDGVLNGTNNAVLGNEIIGFVNTSPLSAYAYQLSRIRRGMRSTPYTGHTSSDQFIVATDAIIRISLAESFVGTTVQVKVLAPTETLADVTAKTTVIIARTMTDLEARVTAIDSPKAANLVFSGPTSGASAAPTFRALVNADLPQIATSIIKGRVTAGTGVVEDLTGTQVNTILPAFGSTTKGLVPAPAPAGTTRFLREDGTWVVPSGGGGTPGGSTTQVQYNSAGSFAGDAAFTFTVGSGLLSITQIATSSATPFKLTNGQLVNIALTSQTSGTTTLTIPDFAGVVDEFTFKTKSQTLSNKTFVAPLLGTPTSGVLTNCTGLPLTSGITGVLPVANGGTNASTASITSFNNITGLSAIGTTGTTSTNLVFSTSPTLVTPVLGTPSSGTLTSCTGLPISTGVSGLGTGVAAFLATPSSANLITAVTDETGSGALVFANTPTLVTPILGATSLTSENFNVAISAANWTTTGVRIKAGPVTLTNSTSSGTVALGYTDKFGGDTLAATSLTTYTDYVGTHFVDPVAGSNVTLTKGWALGADTARVKKGFGTIVSGTTATAFYLEQSGGGDGGASCTHRMFSYNLYTSGSNNLNEATAFIGNVFSQTSAGTTSTTTVTNATTRIQGAGNVTTAEGMIVGLSFSSTGNVTNYWGFHATAPTKSSTGLATGIVAAFRAERMGALGTGTGKAVGLYIDAQYGATLNQGIYFASNASSTGTPAEGITWNDDTNFYRSAADFLKTDDSFIVSRSLLSGYAALTDGATIASNWATGNNFRVTLGGNRTLSNPTNGANGQVVIYEIIQDGAGSRTLALDTKFVVPDSMGPFKLKGTASGRDFITFQYNSTEDKFYLISATCTAKKETRSIVLFSGYTPLGTGADSMVIKLPRLNGQSTNWKPIRLFIRVETPSAGTSTVRCEYYSGTGAFSATNIHTAADLSISGGSTYEASITTFSTTTLAADGKIRINVQALDATHATFFVELEIEEV